MEITQVQIPDSLVHLIIPISLLIFPSPCRSKLEFLIFPFSYSPSIFKRPYLLGPEFTRITICTVFCLSTPLTPPPHFVGRCAIKSISPWSPSHRQKVQHTERFTVDCQTDVKTESRGWGAGDSALLNCFLVGDIKRKLGPSQFIPACLTPPLHPAAITKSRPRRDARANVYNISRCSTFCAHRIIHGTTSTFTRANFVFGYTWRSYHSLFLGYPLWYQNPPVLPLVRIFSIKTELSKITLTFPVVGVCCLLTITEVSVANARESVKEEYISQKPLRFKDAPFDSTIKRP